MAKIHAIANEKAACIVAEGIEQSIYRFQDSLAASENPDDLGQMLNLSGHSVTERLLTGLKGPMILLTRTGCYRKDKDGVSLVESQDGSLDELVSAVYQRCRGTELQFGFREGKTAKLLLSPKTRILAAEEYMSKGFVDKKKQELNNRVYDALTSSLEQIQRRGDWTIKDLISNPTTVARDEWRGSRLRSKTIDLLNEYLHANYGLINTLFLKDTLGDLEKRQNRSRQCGLQDSLDRRFQKNKSLILKGESIEEVAFMLQRETGCMGKHLQYSRLGLLSGETKDISRIYDMFAKREFKLFGNQLQKILGTVACYINKGVYVPELIGEVARDFLPRARLHSQHMWNLENTGVFLAQRITTGQGATIGIIDTGVDYRHKELSSKFGSKKGYDFIRNQEDPMDYNGHGTHVAGTVAGNTTGIANSSQLYALRVLDENGSGNLSDLLEAVSWAILNRLDVINLSLGSKQPSEIEYKVFSEARKAGMLIAAAAGNDQYGPDYPAAYDCVMAVAAVDRNNQHAWFSNIQDTNCISAPGVDVYSCFPGGSYQILSGTSMATPHVAGIGGLAKSLNQNLNQDDFIRIMDKTARPLGDGSDPDNDAIYGAGLVRADKICKVMNSG